MAQDYDYGNARLRARRSRLLTEADYLDLLSRANIEEVITALTETPFRQDIEAALVRVQGVRCVNEASRTNLMRTLRQVRDFFDGQSGQLVDILLRRWDRHNLLTILRGQSRELSPDTVMSALMPVGQLDEVALRELVRQPGLRAAIDLMTTWRLPYAAVLRRVPARAGTIPELDQLELALNQFFFDTIRLVLGEGNDNCALLLEHFQVEIDLINLSTALRLIRAPGAIPIVQQRYSTTDVRPLFIDPGGYLDTRLLAKLVAEVEGLEEVVRHLGDTRYGTALMAGWQRHQAGEKGVVAMEQELERWKAQHTAAMFTRNPLGIAIPIAFIGCKEVEVANLRLVAQAVALDIDREQVQRDLILV